MSWHTVESRVFPAAVAANVITILCLSTFQFDLLIIPPAVGDAIAVVYAAGLLWVAAPNLPTGAGLHRVGSVAAVAVFGSRSLGLLHAWDTAGTAVLAPITETLLILLSVLIWHRRMMTLDVKRAIAAGGP
jgi:hypothetical protein